MAQFIAIVFQQFTVARHRWPMDHPVSQVKKERLIIAVFHEFNRRLGDSIVGIRNPIRLFVTDRRILFHTQRILSIIGCRKILGAIRRLSVNSAIFKAVVKTEQRRTQSKVPFAHMACVIPVVFHRRCQGERIHLKMGAQIRINELLRWPSFGDPVKQNVGIPKLAGMLARDDSGPRRRTSWRGGIRLSKIHALLCQLDHIRCFVRAR